MNFKEWFTYKVPIRVFIDGVYKRDVSIPIRIAQICAETGTKSGIDKKSYTLYCNAHNEIIRIVRKELKITGDYMSFSYRNENNSLINSVNLRKWEFNVK